jgi:eukaryotic-like serine/threonine-protein kinase
MPEDSQARPLRQTAAELLAAIEASGILSEAKWREVQERFDQRLNPGDSLAFAHELVKDGTLTEFQARRLLKGKKSLTFGRYALLDHIGEGGRGRVFKARHRLMDRVVALKVLLPSSVLNETAVSRFFREMKIVALLEDPNVVRAIDADVHEGCPYIVMEYLEGDDLEKVVARRGPLPQNELITYMAQAARGLAHAHAKGVIHRDVKPTNVFLVKSGVVKILDLGCGEFVGMGGQTGNIFDTDEGIVVGTTDFMSPEQVTDKGVDARTDLFSLGCTMYYLLTRKYAFPGLTREDRLVKRIRQGHVPIQDVRPGLSERLVTILDRLLALRPDNRFGSAEEVAEALDELVPPAARDERETSAKSVSKTSRTDATPIPEEPEAPVDWSLIESALRPPGHGAREVPRLVEKSGPKPRSTKSLSSHRKILEAEGIESGRDVHANYRKELIQMNRTIAEQNSAEAQDQPPTASEAWFERIGEMFGDFLAEPSAAQILICILLVLLVLAGALAFVLG